LVMVAFTLLNYIIVYVLRHVFYLIPYSLLRNACNYTVLCEMVAYEKDMDVMWLSAAVAYIEGCCIFLYCFKKIACNLN
jgi:hypothetical protein